MDANKIQKLAVSWRRKSGGTSLYNKRRFKGNRYTKSANTNDKIYHMNTYVTLYLLHTKRWKHQPVKLQVTNNTSTTATTDGTTDTDMPETAMTTKTSMPDSSLLLIDKSILKDIINCVGICPSCQSTNIMLNIDQTKKNGLSLPVTLLYTTSWTTKYYTSMKIKINSKLMFWSECTSSYGYEGNWSQSYSIGKVMWVFKFTRTSPWEEHCWCIQ